MLDPAVQALVDRDAIRDTIHSYCRAIDRKDWALLASCFHPGSTHEHGSFKGLSRDFVDYAADAVRDMPATRHQIGNIVIEFDSPVQARAESCCLAYHRIPANTSTRRNFDLPGGDLDLLIALRYLDRHEKRDGAWRIVHRTGVHDWQRVEPASDHGFYQSTVGLRGAPDATDALYGFFRRGARA